MSTALRALLYKHRETYRRLVELEMADLDRQVATLDKPKANAAQAQGADREHEREMLRVMQAAGAPLPPREIAQRLGTAPKTVSRWLAAAKRRGFVERVDGARYRVAAEVPDPLARGHEHTNAHKVGLSELVPRIGLTSRQRNCLR
jgi:DNA-binding MarR family transcriptional regulator